MSILIKGMEKPKYCGDCFIGDRTICRDGCPLVEIPKHGRLIDADELIFFGIDNPDCDNQFQFVPNEIIESAPTIIEGDTE